jgi:hypothetical protein
MRILLFSGEGAAGRDQSHRCYRTPAFAPGGHPGVGIWVAGQRHYGRATLPWVIQLRKIGGPWLRRPCGARENGPLLLEQDFRDGSCAGREACATLTRPLRSGRWPPPGGRRDR